MISGLVFVRWVFCSLVFVVLFGSHKGVVVLCFRVRDSSGILLGVATGDFGKMCFSVLGADT